MPKGSLEIGPGDRAAGVEDGSPFRIPWIVRGVVRLVRMVPALVTVAFAAWAVGAALEGDATVTAGASLMSLLALSVAVRSAISARGQ